MLRIQKLKIFDTLTLCNFGAGKKIQTKKRPKNDRKSAKTTKNELIESTPLTVINLFLDPARS